jgi:hypothetical protein
MRGHAYKRGTSWTVVYDEQPDDDGKRRQRSKGGFATRKEAERFLTDTLARIDTGSYAQPSSSRSATTSSANGSPPWRERFGRSA